MCLEAGSPVALSSDAHRPDDVGANYDLALELLEDVGVKELCVFEGRERRLEPIALADTPHDEGQAPRDGEQASGAAL
jgi:histidinol-phosphatase (PHP family)